MLLLGLSSSIIMLIIPTQGDRITLYTVLTLTILGIILIDKIIKNDMVILKYLKVGYISISIYLLICFISLNQINNYCENYIKKQLKNNIQTIEVIRNSIMYVWNHNPQSEYFINTYKSYINIPKEKNIKIVSPSYKDYLKLY